MKNKTGWYVLLFSITVLGFVSAVTAQQYNTGVMPFLFGTNDPAKIARPDAIAEFHKSGVSFIALVNDQNPGRRMVDSGDEEAVGCWAFDSTGRRVKTCSWSAGFMSTAYDRIETKIRFKTTWGAGEISEGLVLYGSMDPSVARGGCGSATFFEDKNPGGQPPCNVLEINGGFRVKGMPNAAPQQEFVCFNPIKKELTHGPRACDLP